jgi:hypothetical protein
MHLLTKGVFLTKKKVPFFHWHLFERNFLNGTVQARPVLRKVTKFNAFCVHGSVHHRICYSNQRDATMSSQYLYFTAVLLYLFRAFSTPIIRSTMYYSILYSWWWVLRTAETCRVTLQWNKGIDCSLLHLVGYYNTINFNGIICNRGKCGNN